MSKMTEKQEKFFEVYVDLIRGGAKPKEAANKAKTLAGYSEDVSFRQIIRQLPSDVLTEFYNTRLLEHAPAAIEKVISLSEQGEGRGSKTELAAAESILDRIGISKKTSMSVEVSAPPGLIFLPPKREEQPEE